MDVFFKNDLEIKSKEIITKIREGSIFIYPTDTIYGIGCNALNEQAVSKIRKIKSRPNKPLSIIAPSKQWIRENCLLEKKAENWIKKLPGPYTIILPLKNKQAVAKTVTQNSENLGVRIPRHWISNLVKELNLPIVTTSVNRSGEKFMFSLKDIDPEIKENVDFVIDEGEKQGKPSKIINTLNNSILER